MPGIVGIISGNKPPEECERLVACMTESMMHQSFYTSGKESFAELGVFVGWVAHADSFAAGQTFWNESRDVALLLAGECFFGVEVRTRLERKGHDLGTSAGSSLVHLYEEMGTGFVGELNGLFSGLLVDLRAKKAFLFNDRYGIERLYWHETKEATYFASEAKALLRVLPKLRVFDEEAISDYLRFGCTLEWRTLFRGVQLAPGGSLWTTRNGECHKSKYFSPADWEAQAELSVAAVEEKLAETLERVLPMYFDSSCPVGIALTGGLDTRMIMACLPRTAHAPVCYTYAGLKGETRDARVASRVAEVCGLQHELLRVGPDFFSDYGKWVERSVHVTDGCFGALGAHEVYLNALARRKSTIRVTGVFGSEILRGVSTFKARTPSVELLHTRGASSPVSSSSAWETMHPVTFAAFCEIPWNIQPSLAACRSQVGFRTPFLDNSLVSLAYQVPSGLRRSAQISIRLIEKRNPRLAAIPTDRGYLGKGGSFSRSMRRALAEVTFKLDYYRNEGMPNALARLDGGFEAVNNWLPIFGQHKYLHYRRWFRSQLRDYLRDAVEEIAVHGSGRWDAGEIRRMAEEHISGVRNRIHDIGLVLTLGTAERILLRGAI
jgi:asparagine synthase (glutamine-hydrolysing)